MLDDFRQQANSSAFEEQEEAPAFDEPRRADRRFLGMTPAQRFIIALILLMVTCLLGSFCLLVTERFVLPFI
jgi:hypothetical protein